MGREDEEISHRLGVNLITVLLNRLKDLCWGLLLANPEQAAPGKTPWSWVAGIGRQALSLCPWASSCSFGDGGQDDFLTCFPNTTQRAQSPQAACSLFISVNDSRTPGHSSFVQQPSLKDWGTEGCCLQPRPAGGGESWGKLLESLKDLRGHVWVLLRSGS